MAAILPEASRCLGMLFANRLLPYGQGLLKSDLGLGALALGLPRSLCQIVVAVGRVGMLFAKRLGRMSRATFAECLGLHILALGNQVRLPGRQNSTPVAG